MRPAFIAMHARSGVVGLNVVSAALGADERTRRLPVSFAHDREAVAQQMEAAAARGERPVIAWSFYSTDFERAAEDLAWLRARCVTKGLHVAGGVHASAEPLQTLRAGFDLVAIGEGESTAVELFAALAADREPFSARGLGRLGADGRLETSGQADRRPLDDFPAFNAAAGKYNAIEITRGCAYACSFCQTPFMFKARFRHRSVANVRAHVEAMRRDGLRYVRFLSPTSLSYGAEGREPDLAAVEALLANVREAIGPAGKVYFGTFPSEVRPEHVTPRALALIKRYCDNEVLVIGGQSGSERVLEATHRGHSTEDVARAARLCLEAGLFPDVDFLFGLPGESPAEQRESLAFAQKLAALGARIHGHSFLPLPGTPLGGARPERVEPDVQDALARLESDGALHGQWRKQQALGARLVALRARREDK